MKRYYSLNDYCRERFGKKLYKLSLSTGFTCPNRDGSAGTGGCAFCTGSGEFSVNARYGVNRQIELAKLNVAAKKPEGYIAYFGSGTNTYGDFSVMEKLFTDAVEHPDIDVLSVATRPDCVGSDVMELLANLNKKKPVWVELGLQTASDDTAEGFGRGYCADVYVKTADALRRRGIAVVTHVIFGLPGESREAMMNTIDLASEHTDGIKIHSLYISRGTRWESLWTRGEIRCLDMDEYIELVGDALMRLPKNTVVHRLTGDGDKRTLLAPLWSANKRAVLNAMARSFEERNIIQGESL